MGEGMSRVNVQYSNGDILNRVFRCGNGHRLLMFGCDQSDCKYSQSAKLLTTFKSGVSASPIPKNERDASSVSK